MRQMIEETKRLVVKFVNTLMVLAGLLFIGERAMEHYGFEEEPAHVVVAEAQAEAPKTPTLEEMVEEVAVSYELPPLLLRAVVKHESNDVVDSVREEKHHYNSQMVNKAVKDYPAYMQEEMRKMYSRSYGLGQVMGWHAPRFGLKWSDLLNPKTNLIVTAEVLNECRDRARKDKKSSQSKQDVTKRMLGCYNGDLKNYPPKIFAALGEIVADKM